MENNLKAIHEKLEELLGKDLYRYSLTDEEVAGVLKQLLAIVEPTIEAWKERARLEHDGE